VTRARDFVTLVRSDSSEASPVSFIMPLSDADAASIPEVEKFLNLVKKDRQILHDPRVKSISKLLESLGVQLPPAPQAAAAKPAASSDDFKVSLNYICVAKIMNWLNSTVVLYFYGILSLASKGPSPLVPACRVWHCIHTCSRAL